MLEAKTMIVERLSVRELLAFYLEAGVDTPIAETPADRFADETTAAPITTRAPAVPRELPRSTIADLDIRQRAEGPGRPAPATPPSPEAAIMEAREAARSAANLEELRALLARFDGCPLKSTATQLVFAAGT